MSRHTRLALVAFVALVACPDTPRGEPDLPEPDGTVVGTEAGVEVESEVEPEVETEDGEGPEAASGDPDIEVTPLGCAPGAADPRCDDGDPCTDDLCGERGECVHVPNLAPCDDGDACTELDRCTGGVCTGQARSCDDGLDCTADRCDEGACVHEPRDGPCDDGDVCTEGDRCEGGLCAGSARVCPGAGPCAVARCEARVGCVVEPRAEGEDCDDGEPCTTGTRCLGGVCRGALVDCDDGEVCSDDYCDPALGCVHRDNRAPCDDGDPCTVGDTCDAGRCVAGARESCCGCDDGDPCTVDRCEAGACVSEPGAALPADGQLVDDFEGGLDAWTMSSDNALVGWRLSTSWAASGAASLYCGDASEDGYDHGATRARATARVWVPPGEPRLHLVARREVADAPSCVYDVLKVLADEQVIGLICADGVREESFSLAAYAGREIALGLELDTVDGLDNAGAGVWVDRVRVTAPGCARANP